MPAKPDKPYRIRIRVLDGKPREPNKLKGQLVPHVDVVDAKNKVEFVVCAVKEAHLDQVRAKLGAAGAEEIEGGDTTIAVVASLRPTSAQAPRQGGPQRAGRPQHPRESQGRQGRIESPTATAQPLPGKPYGFVPLPANLKTDTPVWHDGTSSKDRLSGEIRFELQTLTPLLVGWERGQMGDAESDWPLPATIQGVGQLAASKSVLCPLRAPWGKRPVIVPGDSLKGLLRHELGALLGAPMERVAERSYSYRPNAMYPLKPAGRFLVPRLARVPENSVEIKALDDEHQARVPTRLELFPAELEYNKKANKLDYRFDQNGRSNYRGGQGAGQKLNSKVSVHASLKVLRDVQTETADVPQAAQEGYLATLRHLVDLDDGHFSERHPDVPSTVRGEDARNRILTAAEKEVFQPGDLIWVEWDTDKKCIVSLGWHYYYRWAYTDTIRKDADAPRLERHGLFPLDDERACDDDGAPKGLSPVRRLFGYTKDNEGSAGIGKDDHAQLMGRISVNAALEVVADGDTDDERFLPPTFLKELGMPRPSAVEFYLKQLDYPNPKGRTDRAKLLTYGDAAGYDTPGELAGRKFYLDRKDAYSSEPWKDDSSANRANERSTLALEASRPGRRFRFTIRFRDLDVAELAAIMVALCPHQFRDVFQGKHPDGYCSKLGYARPLGWGTVRIEAKALLLLDVADGRLALKAETDVLGWVRRNYQPTATQADWLAVHRHKHPDAADYPRATDQQGNENIYTFHTTLRAEHSRLRRYRRE
jgi:CRISPR-associated protein (TIGR03986 family)